VNRNEGELIRPVNDTKLKKILITQPKSEKGLYFGDYLNCVFMKKNLINFSLLLIHNDYRIRNIEFNISRVIELRIIFDRDRIEQNDLFRRWEA